MKDETAVVPYQTRRLSFSMKSNSFMDLSRRLTQILADLRTENQLRIILVLVQFGRAKQNPESTLHKYRTGSCRDRIQASLQSKSNVQINLFIEATIFCQVEHLAPGPRSLQLPVPYLCGVRRVVLPDLY